MDAWSLNQIEDMVDKIITAVIYIAAYRIKTKIYTSNNLNDNMVNALIECDLVDAYKKLNRRNEKTS